MKGAIHFNIKTILILLLGGFFVYKVYIEKPQKPSQKYEQEKHDGKKYNVIKFKVDTFFEKDTSYIEKRGDDFFIEKIVRDTLIKLVDVDTAKILEEYFTKLVVNDTFYLKDTFGFVFIRDTITENKLVYRKWGSDIDYKKIVITKILERPPVREMYLGIYGSIDKVNLLNSIGASALYKDKKNRIFQFGLGISNTNKEKVAPYINGGAYWKLSLKPKN